MSTDAHLKTQILEDTKAAMKAKDKDRLGVLRLITAALKQKEIDERIILTDSQILSILDKMVKQRRDSIAQYRQAQRDDLAAVEESEIQIISQYLPEPFSEEEIDALIADAITKTDASSMQDMGKVMNLLKDPLQGRADFKIVSEKIKAALQA
ncbi:MAG: GatB/YqeY domain-containing protein [Gammaproteobacteria bacterium]